MTNLNNGKQRCPWALADPLYIAYHDQEWGVPLYDDRRLFEMLILEGAQAGLSWLLILKKRDHYRQVFDGFDPQEIASYDQAKQATLLKDKGIVRNRLKIEATIANARAYLTLAAKGIRFKDFIWQFTPNGPIHNAWHTIEQVPVSTKESTAMSKELRRQGFRFVGPTICYAFMQAVGMVNDHLVECFRYREIM